MQGLIKGLRSCQETVKLAILKTSRKNMLSRFGCVTSSQSMSIEEKGLENVTVADILMTKDEENVGSWFSCRINDNVEDATKNMAEHNIGSLVVLKPGEQQHIAGIITERVRSDTSILQAMQLMTMIDGKMIGMVSIVDVVRAVVEQQKGELKRMNDFIKGDYY
ncbi:hypothetical protein PTKIN_Ptkin13bG0008000 [Pterospermum kingtungense]